MPAFRRTEPISPVGLLSDGSLVRQGTPTPLGAVCSLFSPDGQYVATPTPYGVYLYRFSDMSLLHTLSSGQSYNTLVWSPDSTMIAAGGYNGGNPPLVDVWNVSGAQVTRLAGLTGQVRALGWSPDGAYLSGGGDDPVFRIWRFSDGTVVQTYDQETGGSPAGTPNSTLNLRSIAYSVDGKKILYGRGDATVVAIANPVWVPFVISASAPSPVPGGANVQGKATLNGAAPSSGIVVSLTSSRPGVAHVPASVTVRQGATSAIFLIHGGTVGLPTPATITASTGGKPVTTTVTVDPVGGLWLTGVSASPAIVPGGWPSTGTVTLNEAAPSDTTATLSSGNPVATVPASVIVSAGASSAAFPITTSAVTSRTSVALHASYNGGTVGGPLTVTITPVLQSLTLYPATIVGGNASTGVVKLSAAAPAGGLPVSVTSSISTVASVPGTVTVAAGSVSAKFSVTTTAVRTSTVVTITASYSGVSVPADLQVKP